jgi:hypothetical protein
MQNILANLLAGGVAEFLAWVTSMGGLAVVVPVLLQVAKQSKRFPWLDEYTTAINRGLAILAAALATAGISYTFDGVVGQLVITGLTALGIAKFLLAAASQFGLQELVYHFIVQRLNRR